MHKSDTIANGYTIFPRHWSVHWYGILFIARFFVVSSCNNFIQDVYRPVFSISPRIILLVLGQSYVYQCQSLEWRHNGPDGVSNHQPHHCSLNRLFSHRSKKTSLAFVRGIHRWPVNSPHKWPVTRKMFRFDDVIMGEATLYDVNLMGFYSYHSELLSWLRAIINAIVPSAREATLNGMVKTTYCPLKTLSNRI